MRRASRSPVVLTSMAALVLLLSGALGFRELGAREDRSALSALATLERSAHESRNEALDATRRAFTGELREGNAWDGYERALALAPSADVGGIETLTRGEGALRDGELRRLVAEWAPALERLRSGARSATAATGEDVDWASPIGRVTAVLELRSLVNAGTASAELAIRDGRDLDAVAELLDLGRFAMDYRNSASFVDESLGIAFAAIVLEFASPERLDRLDEAALAELERGLAVWDDAFPVPSTVARTELARLSFYVLEASAAELAECADLTECLVAGYSREGAVTEALLAFWEDVDAFDGAVHRPWPERLELFGEREKLRRGSANPVLRQWSARLDHQMQFERQGREVLAHLRLLRIELAWRLRGDRLELADPTWDGPLRFEDSAGLATVCAAVPSFLGERIERALPAR